MSLINKISNKFSAVSSSYNKLKAKTAPTRAYGKKVIKNIRKHPDRFIGSYKRESIITKIEKAPIRLVNRVTKNITKLRAKTFSAAQKTAFDHSTEPLSKEYAAYNIRYLAAACCMSGDITDVSKAKFIGIQSEKTKTQDANPIDEQTDFDYQEFSLKTDYFKDIIGTIGKNISPNDHSFYDINTGLHFTILCDQLHSDEIVIAFSPANSAFDIPSEQKKELSFYQNKHEALSKFCELVKKENYTLTRADYNDFFKKRFTDPKNYYDKKAYMGFIRSIKNKYPSEMKAVHALKKKGEYNEALSAINELLESICIDLEEKLDTIDLLEEKMDHNQLNCVMDAFLGSVPTAYKQAESIVKKIKEDNPDKHIVLTGYCFGGSLATYAALNNQVDAKCFNTFPLGVGLQQKLGKQKLETAQEYIQHFSVRGDLTSDSASMKGYAFIFGKGIKYLDRLASYSGISTPGIFGKKYVMPAARENYGIYERHKKIENSMLVHAGWRQLREKF